MNISSKKAVLKEKEAFLRMEKELIEKYADKFVAVLDGEVVGSGDDEIELALSVWRKQGRRPIYIGKTGEKERVVKM